MKVSCQACGAHYNLPDDKVRGRKAKVRCKKCGANIVVDGTAIEGGALAAGFDEEDEATRVMDMPVSQPSSTWTVNLSDEDQREMTTAEIVAGWVAGTVTDDAYVWRDGMDEWLPILSSPDLGDAIRKADPNWASRTSAATSVEAPAAKEPSAPVAEPPKPPAANVDVSPAAPKVAEKSAPKAAAAPKSSPTASTFGAKTASTALGGGAAKRPSVTAGLFGPLPDNKGKAVTGKQAARSMPAAPDPFAGAKIGSGAKTAENSVMFSLDALKAAAAAEEGGRKEQDTRISEDLLVMGGPSGYDLNPLPLIQIDMPPPAPVQAAPAALGGSTKLSNEPVKSGSMTTVLMGVGGLAIVVAVFFGVRSLTSGSDKAPEPAASVSAEGERKAAAPEGEASQAPATETSAAAAASEAPAESAAAAASAAPAATQVSKPPAAGGGGSTPKPAAQAGGGGGATPPKPATPKPESGGGGGGKGPFDVAAAKDALGAAASQAKLCKSSDGPTGSGKVQITFAPSGRVTSATVQGGPFAGTSVGGCVARAFRGARVPPFDGASQTVSKGFTIN